MQASEHTISAGFNWNSERLRYGILCFCLLLLVACYWGTFASLVGIWMKSDTFAHGFLIGPIALYLIYERREFIARAAAGVSWIGLFAIAGTGALWFVGFIADVQVVQQLAVVTMIPCLVLLILGWRRTWEMAFPLGFLLLAVPFGETLTPHLIDLTADFVVSALRWSGIPVYREATQFIIPSGSWSVVSGCSGMRYLMATITVAALFAYLNYVSLSRRVIFVTGSILVAIVANWLRAYGIVMIAHYSDMRLALGIDHYIYGWVFFGIIIFSLMALGRIWQEDPADSAVTGGPSLAASGNDGKASADLGLAAIFAVSVLLVWPTFASFLVHGAQESAPAPSGLMSGLPPHWHASDGPLGDWSPEFYGASSRIETTFRFDDVEVGLFLAWYGKQEQGAEVVNAKNRLVWEKHKRWKLRRRGVHEIGDVPGVERVIENEMAAPETDFLVWQWYWNAGRTTTTPFVAKIRQIISQVSGGGSAAASIIVYTRIFDDDFARARATLTTFGQVFNPILQRSLDDAIKR